MKKIILVIVLIQLGLNFKPVHAHTSSHESDFESKLNHILISLHKKGEFNGNVLVAKNDSIIYKKSFGFANGDKNASLTATDQFNIGSIYKEIPAIAIMQMQEKNLLQLDDSIDQYLSGLPSWSQKVTILNLLQYTSGLPKINWMKHKQITQENLMNDLHEITQLNFTPGKGYLYTNYSPFLLSKIVEKISNKSFEQYCENNIINPLKLNNSQFKQSFPYQNRTSMAVSFNDDFIEDKPPFTIKAAMFLFSTSTEDLFKLLKGLHSSQLINQKSLKVLSQTAHLKTAQMQSALGNVKLKNNKIYEHLHHGSSGNFESIVYRNNQKNISIIILTNKKSANVHDIKNSILNLL